ncbi:hypothetical protein CcCBS67573_g07674, partial [Chytriomyces confervae]
MFKTIFALLPVLASIAAAHGGISDPVPITGPVPANPTNRNFKAVGNTCGRGAQIPAGPATVNWVAGTTVTMMYFTLNGDGAGPVTATLDPTGAGTFKNGTPMNITQQVPGTNGNQGAQVGPNPMQVVVPNTPCQNCLVQVKNAGRGFGSCVQVNIAAAPAAAGAAAPAAAAVAAPAA